MGKVIKILNVIRNSKYTAIIIFIFYIVCILFLAIKEPILYALALIPLTFACIAYKYLSKRNAKFLKEFNDTLLYLIASIKALAYAGNNIEINFLKKVASFFQETDPFLISWVIILTCTYLKALICASECISALRNKKEEKEQKGKIKTTLTPIKITVDQSLRISTEQLFSIYNKNGQESKLKNTKKLLILQSTLMESEQSPRTK
ncbi:hypothetical protein KKZ45_15395 [Enterobacter bugandensis]|uniref:hypothetical protein n=1 Tax=Enterobacter bugandensis TaxID=881260 RepID=UPI001BE08ED4|nr:hypothetical protein [Enterobacter bugandensis]MBT2091617.1 hypothetical protein [Enterobacter bugandensis]